jgi:outer membrane lipoprotein-sorting protein
MKRIKTLIISLFVFIVTGCANKKEKCVTIVDEFDNKISNVKVKFTSIKKRNSSSFGNLVTTFSPFHEVDIELTIQKGNLICFENYKYKDEQFIYNDLRTWEFYNDSSEIVYNSFDSISSKIVLMKNEVK